MQMYLGNQVKTPVFTGVLTWFVGQDENLDLLRSKSRYDASGVARRNLFRALLSA